MRKSAQLKRDLEGIRRLNALLTVDALARDGMGRTAAYYQVAATRGSPSVSTLRAWDRLRWHEPASAWLSALTPKPKSVSAIKMTPSPTATMDESLYANFVSDYLRLQCPTMASCWRRTERIARSRNLAMPSITALRRRLRKEFNPQAISAARDGLPVQRAA